MTTDTNATANPLAGKLSDEDLALFNQHIAQQVGISVAEVEKRMKQDSADKAVLAIEVSKAYAHSLCMHMLLGMAAGAVIGFALNRFGIPAKIASIFTSSNEAAS